MIIRPCLYARAIPSSLGDGGPGLWDDQPLAIIPDLDLVHLTLISSRPYSSVLATTNCRWSSQHICPSSATMKFGQRIRVRIIIRSLLSLNSGPLTFFSLIVDLHSITLRFLSISLKTSRLRTYFPSSPPLLPLPFNTSPGHPSIRLGNKLIYSPRSMQNGPTNTSITTVSKGTSRIMPGTDLRG